MEESSDMEISSIPRKDEWKPTSQIVFKRENCSMSSSGNKNYKPMNTNQYATMKTIAQGMLDIALLTENVAQLRNVLRLGMDKHPFYVPMLYCIAVSISLQIIVGISIIIIGSIKIQPKKKHSCAEFLNIAIVIQVFFIAVINVIISGFAIEHTVVEEEKYLRQDHLKRLCQGFNMDSKGAS